MHAAPIRHQHVGKPSGSARARRGFTLIETALATMIVGIGVIAVVTAQQAFIEQNEWSTHASTAQRLGNEIRELTLRLPQRDPVTGAEFWGPEPDEPSVEDYDDLDDFDGEDGDGLVFSAALGNGPISALGEPIPDMEGWSQRVFVENVEPFDLVRTVPDGASALVRIRVVVEFMGPRDAEPRTVTEVRWIAPG